MYVGWENHDDSIDLLGTNRDWAAKLFWPRNGHDSTTRECLKSCDRLQLTVILYTSMGGGWGKNTELVWNTLRKHVSNSIFYSKKTFILPLLRWSWFYLRMSRYARLTPSIIIGKNMLATGFKPVLRVRM